MTDSAESNASPVDSFVVPRFVGVSTFMRAAYRPGGSPDIDIALAGVPFDFPSGRGQPRLAPAQIREMSRLVRQISSRGVAPFELCTIADVGDAGMNPFDHRRSADIAADFIAGIVDQGSAVVVAGGDHGTTYPVLKGAVRDGPVGLVHFDSHPDTYQDTYGVDGINHGNAVVRAIEDGMVDPARTISVGIRGTRFSTTDRDYHESAGMRLITMEEFDSLGVEATLAEIHRVIGDGPTYITFDIDSLDTPYAVGTGAPEPGGLSMREAFGLLRGLAGAPIIGGDVVEVSPPNDPTGHTALCAANLMFELVCLTAQTIDARRSGADARVAAL
jgi:guanidinopropionase